MSIPQFTLRQMMEAGVHFGHHSRRWNPRMEEYIFGKRDNVHIIDLQKTYPMFYKALAVAQEVASQGGKVLFVGTKRQAQEIIKTHAERCGQYYVNQRWLGGMMTNWKTIHKSISRFVSLNNMFEKGETEGYTKKELQGLQKELDKLQRELGGIKDMGGQPDLIFALDVIKEDLAIKEANKLGIPVIGICDTNSNPEGIDYIVPGNDDAIRSIEFYCDNLASAILSGIQAEITAKGVKIDETPKAAKPVVKKAAPKKEAKVEKATEEK